MADTLSRIDSDQIVNIDCDNQQGQMNATKDKLYQIFDEDSLSNETLFYWNEER